MVPQVAGKAVGLIGTGAIGKGLAKTCKGIGCGVIGWTFHPRNDVAEWVPFDDVFRQSHFVSVHVRQSPETMGMIRREHFKMMRPSAILINTARGAIVNESDLVKALQTDQIAGAGLDVFEQEPLPSDSPFFPCPTLFSPHIRQRRCPRRLRRE
jgi:D-3-phosphoglycerate dehydrogenase